jgi:predicted TIM-barrel fold metal-dependent hydrolase
MPAPPNKVSSDALLTGSTAMTHLPSYDGPIFDADSHIREKDWSFFRKYLPEKYWADWLMASHALPDGTLQLRIGSRPIENMESADGKMAPPGKLKEWLRAIATGDEIIERILPEPDMYACPERLAKLDEFGVDGCVLYIGDFVGAFGLLGVLAEEKGPEGANAVFRAYNEYLYAEWTYNREDRIYATPVLSLWDLAWSLEEADRLIERGVRIIVMPMGPANGRAPADPYFDPLWKKLDAAGVAVSFHVSEANFMHPLIRAWGEEPLQSRRKGQTAWQWVFAYSELPVMMTMASFVYWNFFERFPNIRLCSAENGAEWLPRFLYKMDKMRGMARNGFWPMGQLKERPSTIFKRHCFVVAYPEDNLSKIAEDMGGDIGCLLMGSDYPHAEGVPTPKDFVAEACSGLTEQQIRQVMHDNGRRFLPRSLPATLRSPL